MRWLTFQVTDNGVTKDITVREQDVSRVEVVQTGDIYCPDVVTIVIKRKKYISVQPYEEVMAELIGEPLSQKNRGGE